MTTRVCAPSTAGGTVTNVNKSTYRGNPGQIFDVPDLDAQALAAAGWGVLGTVGSTASRPSAPTVIPTVSQHIDTTLNAAVYWDGKTWRHSGSGQPV